MPAILTIASMCRARYEKMGWLTTVTPGERIKKPPKTTGPRGVKDTVGSGSDWTLAATLPCAPRADDQKS